MKTQRRSCSRRWRFRLLRIAEHRYPKQSNQCRRGRRFKKVASANVLKVGGIVAIIAGAYLIWDQIIVRVLIRLLSDTGAEILSQISYKLPQVAVAVILIVVGIKLISHKKRELERKNNEEEDK